MSYDEDEKYYGAPKDLVTCVVVLNFFGMKSDAHQIGRTIDRNYAKDTDLLQMFQDLGFSSFQDFSLKMTVDEARDILYYSGKMDGNELSKIAEECRDRQ